ncbi:MAG: glutathione S-transferase family protein [Candidatus Binataceae bacterium]
MENRTRRGDSPRLVLQNMLTLYDCLPSGNAYKVRLLLAQLEIPSRRVELDVTKGETRTPEFLAKFPNGRVPAIEFEDGRLLFESNAILCYFAEGTPLLPTDRTGRAQVLQWLFFEQYSHEPYIAVRRFLLMYPDLADERRALMDRLLRLGNQALAIMDAHLQGHDFFVGGRYSIADIALYAYTHVAHQGGFELAGFPSISNWLERVQAQPHHLPITEAPA